MGLVNRKNELKILEDEYKRDGSSFVIIYGRRRTGKTTLISEFLKRYSNSLYFLATEESEEENKKEFKNMVASFTKNELLFSSDIGWLAIFKQISNYKKSKKKIIVIDEFQYLGISNKAFPSIIQKTWDTIMKGSNIMFIICGSFVSLMREQTLNYSSPLYGRRTAQIRLKQIKFKYYSEFFNNKSRDELIPFYAVTGGVPKYIEMFRSSENIYDGIKNYILNRQSFLYEEPYFLLQKEVKGIGSYFSLLKAISSGNHKLGDIASAMGVKTTSITKYLNTLIGLDLVIREVPITEKNPDKSKNGLYKITDNYIAFWFKFVYPYRSYLENGEEDYVLNIIKNGLVQNYVSYIYEDISREKMWELNINDFWDFRFQKVGRYWGNKTGEIDIVALDELGKNIILGECKYTSSEVGLDVLHNLQEKGAALKKLTKSVNAEYVIFSTGGFTKGLLDEAKNNYKVKLIS